jgi:hypothetical protein
MRPTNSQRFMPQVYARLRELRPAILGDEFSDSTTSRLGKKVTPMKTTTRSLLLLVYV